jgi:hypothetical protein
MNSDCRARLYQAQEVAYEDYNDWKGLRLPPIDGEEGEDECWIVREISDKDALWSILKPIQGPQGLAGMMA